MAKDFMIHPPQVEVLRLFFSRSVSIETIPPRFRYQSPVRNQINQIQAETKKASFPYKLQKPPNFHTHTHTP